MKYAEISAEGENVGGSTRAVRPLASALKQIAKNLLVCCDYTVRDVLHHLSEEEVLVVLEEMEQLKNSP